MSTAARRRNRRPSEAEVTPPTRTRCALQHVNGPLLRTDQHAWLWFRLPPQRWNFLEHRAREAKLFQLADQLAELEGHWCHLRVTHRPESPSAWAAAHHRLAPADARLPDVPGAVSFDEHLVGEQHAMAGRAMMSKEVYLGVLLSSRTLADRAISSAPGWMRRRMPRLAQAEVTGLDAEVEHVTQVLAGIGANAATPREVDWLLTRSFALGLPIAQQRPVPIGTLDRSDLDSYVDLARPEQEPHAPSVTMRGQGPLAGHTRSVVVLTLGVMQPLTIPEADDPWMARVDRLGAPIEWSCRFFVRSHDTVSRELSHQADKVRAQIRHYTEDHGLPPPKSLGRQAELAQVVDDELSSGLTQRGTRLTGWWRMALSAPDEDAALELAHRIDDLYKPKVRIEHPRAQWAHAREFIPGEPLASGAFMRRGSVIWAAGAMPHVVAEVGDRQGVLLGETVTRQIRPVAWDLWRSQAADSSGLTAVVAGLGGGKTVAAGVLIAKTLRLGARWVVLDPSGPLAQLAAVPELAPYARTVNLLDAAPGTLNPYRLIADPLPEHYARDDDPDGAWRRASAWAAATRRRLVLDTLTGLLPYAVQQLPATRMVLQRAIRAVGSARDNSPAAVLRRLRHDESADAEHAHNLADLLADTGERLQLLIPDEHTGAPEPADEHRLTVLTMPGLTIPSETVSRADWDAAEAESVVLLNLAAWLTQRTIYDRPMAERSGVFIDEAHFLSSVTTGRVLMDRFARDSRKWNLRVLLSSQLPADLLRIDGLDSLLDSALVGSLNGEQARADALRLLNVPSGHGYEQVFDTFPTGTDANDNPRPRHFLFRDSTGAVERIRADYSAPHLAQVMTALRTTPGSAR